MLRILKLIIASLAIINLNLVAQTQIDISNNNAVIKPDPAIKMGTLPNGLKYYIKKNNKPEKKVELRLAINAGSINEDEDQNGLAHFVEHMLFNGTESYPSNELIKFLEKTGVRFGADLNAYTFFDRTVYMIPMPADNDKTLNEGFKVLGEWAGKALMEDEEINKERGVIREEMRLREGVQQKANDFHGKTNFKGSKYADHNIIGDAKTILECPTDNVKRFYRDWYRPDLMAVIAVGDFDVNKMEQMIKDNFSYLKNPANPRVLPKSAFTIDPNKEPLVSIYQDEEQTSPMLMMVYKREQSPDATVGQYRERYIETLISTIMAERLQEKTLAANPPYLFAVAQPYSLNKYTGGYLGYAALKADDILGGFSALTTEIYRAKNNGLTASEITRAKQNILSGIENMVKEKDKTNSETFADEYIRNFLDNEPIPGIEGDYAFYAAFDQAVSEQEVNEYFAKLITNDNILINLTAPKNDAIKVPSEADFANELKKIQSAYIEAYVDNVSDKPLFSKSIQPGSIRDRKEMKEVGVTMLTLSNGVKIQYKQTDFSEDEVLFAGYSHGGASLISDKDHYNGIFAADIMDNCGLSDFDPTSLSKVLTGKQISISPYISDYAEGFRGSFTNKDMETFMQLLHLYFTDPRKDDENFASWKNRMTESIANSKRNPQAAWADTLTYSLNSYDKRKQPMTSELISSVDLEVAYKLYQERFSDPSDFTFFFVGPIKADEFEKMLNLYVGSLKSTGKSENPAKVFKGTSNDSFKKVVKSGKENKSQVMLVMNGGMDYNQQARYDLNTLVAVLRIRLTESLREDKGGVYSPGVWARMSNFPKGEYSISVSFGCDPERVDELITEVKNIVEIMKKELPTDDEMERVAETNKKVYETSLKENRTWLSWMQTSYSTGENLKDVLNYPKLVSNMKKDDVKKAANQYLNMSSFKEFILLPEGM